MTGRRSRPRTCRSPAIATSCRDSRGSSRFRFPSPTAGTAGSRSRAVDEPLPEAVGAFVAWLLKESGWHVTERERPGEAVPISARHVCLLFRRFTSWGRDVTRAYVEALGARGGAHPPAG